MPCLHGESGWPCPNCRGLGGHWYEGEPVPRECVTSTLPVDYGISVPWDRDLQPVPKELLDLKEGGGLPMVEELLGRMRSRRSRGSSPLWVARWGYFRLLSRWRSGP